MMFWFFKNWCGYSFILTFIASVTNLESTSLTESHMSRKKERTEEAFYPLRHIMQFINNTGNSKKLTIFTAIKLKVFQKLISNGIAFQTTELESSLCPSLSFIHFVSCFYFLLKGQIYSKRIICVGICV